MATLKPATLKPSHQKTDSEALEDLSQAFHDFDIDGEGLLDQASFLTALRMLGVTIPPSEVEKIFEVLDEDGTGMIAYKKLKEFMKIGKIPSTILNKVKSTGNTKRTSVVFGGSSIAPNGQIKYRLPMLNENNQPTTAQTEGKPEDNKKPMDHDRMKMIQRAVIVIKKAVMKNISRTEVIGFLADKGMDRDDIELAYSKAAEQVMSPEERIKYLSDLSETRLDEVNEQKKMNEFLSTQMATQTQEIQILRALLKVSTDKLKEIFPNQSDEIVSKQAANELTQKIQQTTKDMKQAQEQKDEPAKTLHETDLKSLQNVSECVTNKQYFHANLYFHQLESVIRDSMPQLQAFLDDYIRPSGDEQDHDNDD